MNLIVILLFGILFSQQAFADDLTDEIRSWKKGQEVPHKLLSFPSGNVPDRDLIVCGIGEDAESVRPYIQQIDDAGLLEEIVFDSRSDSASLKMAILRLGELKGLKWVANRLNERPSFRWEIQMLRQALQSRFSRLEVAFIAKKDMSETRAMSVLSNLKTDLDNGITWSAALSKASQANPDMARRKREPEVPTTLVGYWFSGWISRTGFSFSTLSRDENLHDEHLKRVIGAARGGYIMNSSDGVYLYYVFDSWNPA